MGVELREIELKMNEMCDLLGVSAQGIRMYEKHGAIHSFKYEGNGYRYYYFEDIGPTIQMRSMRKMGIPLAECARNCTGQQLEELEESLNECRSRIEANIRYEQALLQVIDEMAAASKWAVSHLHRFEECIRPAMYYLPCEQQGTVLHDRAGRKLIRNWSEHFPFVHYCPMVPKEGLGAESVSRIGFCLLEKDFAFTPDLDHKQVCCFPEETCIGGVVCVTKSTKDYYSVVEPGLTYMEKEGYELTGDIYSMMLAAEIKRGEEILDYYYAWYPCRKREK